MRMISEMAKQGRTLYLNSEIVIHSDDLGISAGNALLLANMVDEVLRNYGRTYGILSNVMLNMASMEAMSNNGNAKSVTNGNEQSNISIIRMVNFRQLSYLP